MIKISPKAVLLRLSVLFLAFFLIQPAFAAPSPLPMMKGVAQNMITALKRNQNRLSGNSELIRRIVDRVLIPHVDLHSVAGRVIGREYWLEGTAAQRAKFTQLFKRRITNTYATALASFNDDRVLFYPMRATQGAYADVRSLIVRRSGQKIPVSYSLRYTNGQWKIIDFSVENVSIVNNYKAQYASALGAGGLKNLIAHIRQ